eukprot:TRINITY_DN34182_c0_g1_i1.p3 TRINITY_DN34182_c0_g1~~TRINITY_DN34182_c0_g1_i1.p3  ORF type:complete len:146 (+),score=22.96 TRINITY_DN34182_c0_g1_i1:263-700(+)
MPGHPPVPPARNYTARGQRLFKAWNDIHSDFDGLRAVYHKDAWISASFGEENPVAGSIEVVHPFLPIFSKHHMVWDFLASTSKVLVYRNVDFGETASGCRWHIVGLNFLEYDDAGLVTKHEYWVDKPEPMLMCLKSLESSPKEEV